MEIIITGGQNEGKTRLSRIVAQSIQRSQDKFDMEIDPEAILALDNKKSKMFMKKIFINSISIPDTIRLKKGYSSNIASTVIVDGLTEQNSEKAINTFRKLSKGMDINFIYCILK